MGNGKIERWHRTLKAAIMAHSVSNNSWTDVLPTILLGLHCTVREDVGISPAEMVYGTILRLPGEFFDPSNSDNTDRDPLSLVAQLREKMKLLRPIPDSDHASHKIFFSQELDTCSHVVKKVLQPPYDGPFPVLKRFSKYFTI